MHRLTALASAAVVTLLLASTTTAARTGLALEPAVGPPTSLVKAKGSGFAAGEVVALYFDGARVGSDVASRTGKVNSRLSVPVSARPGEHTVEAIGQASGVSARAAFLVRTDWLQGCFDAGRSCFNPYENVLGPANVAGLAPAWRAQVGADGKSSSVYANGKLFVGTLTGLLGLDPATGAIIINDRSGPVTGTPAVIRGFDPQPDPPGKVIFGTGDGVLHALSTSGEPLWQVGLGAVPASPLVAQGIGDPNVRVVVGAGNTLFAFDGNGGRLWATVLEGGAITKAAAVMTVPPEPEELVVAVGNTLYALDATTGAVIWASTPSRSRLGAPAIGDPTLIGDPSILVGDEAGMLFALDARTGAVNASFTARGRIGGSAVGDPNLIGDPNESEPWVFVGDGGGNIYAFDTTDEFPPPVWSAALGGPVDGPPILANGVLYAATDPEVGDPHIFALDAKTGRALFESALPGGLAASPIVTDGRLIIATRSGELLAYEALA
jgi:outer membrane protein assembly factor BamB